MANMLIPVSERDLTPDEVEALDRRRRRGQLFLVIGFQCTIVSCLLTLWSGQDFTYSPNGMHLIGYWNIITAALAVFFLASGVSLRRGSTEFISY